MADRSHLNILIQGVEAWNAWREREENLEVLPDLSGINFNKADMRGVDFSGAHLHEADLGGTDLTDANLMRANLFRTNLIDANLTRAALIEASIYDSNLDGADLTDAFARGADIYHSSMRNVMLDGADLSHARLVKVDLEHASLSSCTIYGVSAWDLKLKETKQTALVITEKGDSIITVDNLEVAQFIYLLLNNEKIRDVIDTITTKVVLILGRFTPDRKEVLDAIRERLRALNYLPILFDFTQPTNRDTHETVTILARLARFIIADITDPSSVPQELVSIVETLPSVPVQPLIKRGSKPWNMYDHIKRYKTVLKLHRYDSLNDLLPALEEKVITPAEVRAKRLLKN